MTDVDTGLGQNHVTENTFFNGFHSHLLIEDRQFLELIFFFLTFNQGYQEFLLYFNVGSGTNISFLSMHHIRALPSRTSRISAKSHPGSASWSLYHSPARQQETLELFRLQVAMY